MNQPHTDHNRLQKPPSWQCCRSRAVTSPSRPRHTMSRVSIMRALMSSVSSSSSGQRQSGWSPACDSPIHQSTVQCNQSSLIKINVVKIKRKRKEIFFVIFSELRCQIAMTIHCSKHNISWVKRMSILRRMSSMFYIPVLLSQEYLPPQPHLLTLSH